jgi:hypothetical protein
MLIFCSCVNIKAGNPISITCPVTYRHHEDSKTEWIYHYGYSSFDGKFCLHYGPEKIPEQNIIKFTFMNEVLERNDVALFYKSEVIVTYRKIYYDNEFDHNEIISVK